MEESKINIEILDGNGPYMVMLHGWGRSLEVLRGLAELLCSVVRPVLVDLPGFGSSALPHAASNAGGGWGTADYAKVVYEELVKRGVSSAILLGHSFGGRVSIRIAREHPEFVENLILVGSHGLKRERPINDEVRVQGIRLLGKLTKFIDKISGRNYFKDKFSPRFGSRDYLAAGDLQKTLVKTVTEDQSPELSQIKAKTLLLWGENDTETPLDLAQKFKRGLPNSRLVVLPDKGHEPFADVGAHLCAKIIERFLVESSAAEVKGRVHGL